MLWVVNPDKVYGIIMTDSQDGSSKNLAKLWGIRCGFSRKTITDGFKTDIDPHVSLLPLQVGKNWTNWDVFYVGQKEDRVVASQFPKAMNQRDPQNSVVSSPRMETTAFEGTF